MNHTQLDRGSNSGHHLILDGEEAENSNSIVLNKRGNVIVQSTTHQLFNQMSQYSYLIFCIKDPMKQSKKSISYSDQMDDHDDDILKDPDYESKLIILSPPLFFLFYLFYTV